MAVQVDVGDVAVMRKPHACGGSEWQIMDTAGDIRMKCLRCGRKVILHRDAFERQVKSVLRRG